MATSEHQTSETSWVNDDLDNTSFESLVEQVQQLVGGGVQKKKKIFRDNIEPLQLRPSVVDRALQKKIISSTPLVSKYINPKFLPDSSSVSSITDKELEERNEEISKDVFNVSDNNRLKNQSKRKNQSNKGNKLKEKCDNNNLSNVSNNIDKNNSTHTSESPHRECGSINLERSKKVDGDGDFVIPNVLPEEKSKTNTDPIVSTEAKSSKIPFYNLRCRTLNENGRTNYATSKSVLEPISNVEMAQEVENTLQLNNSDKENSNQNVCVENKINNDVEHRICQKPPIPKPRKKRMYTQTDTEMTIHNNDNVDLPTEPRPRVSEKLDPKPKANVSVQTSMEFESPTSPKYRKTSRLSTFVGKITQIAQSKSSSSNKSRNLFKTTLPDTADKVIQTSNRPLSPSFISKSNYTQDETEESDVSSNESSILNYTRFIEESQKTKNLGQRKIKQNFLKKYRKRKAKDRLRRYNIDSNSLRSETINTTSSAEVLENIDLPDTPTRIQTMQNNRHVLQICNKWLSDIEKEKTESIISDRESIISDRESYCSHKNLHVSTHNTSKSILTINKDSFQNNINDDHDDESSNASKSDCSNKEYQSSINNPSKSISHVKTNKTLVQNDINNDGDDETSCTVIAPNAAVDQEYESPSGRKINCVIKEYRTSRNNRSKNISPVNKDLFEHEVNEDQDDEASLFHLSYLNKDHSDESPSARKSAISNRSKHISHTNKSLVQNDVNDDRDNEISSVIATNRSNKKYRISADNRSKNISSVDKAALQDDMHDGRGYESPSGRKRNSLFSQTPKDNRSKDISHIKKSLLESDRNDDRDNEISSVDATNCSNKEYPISTHNLSKNKSSVKASLQDDVNDGRGYASPSVMKRNSLISQTPKDNRSKDISHIKKALLESNRNNDRNNEISSVDATNCSNKEYRISADNRPKNKSSVIASLQDDVNDGRGYVSPSVMKRNSLISQTPKDNRSKYISHIKKALLESDRNDDRDNEISSVDATNCSNKEDQIISTDNRSKNKSSVKASLQDDVNDGRGYASPSVMKRNSLISQTPKDNRSKNASHTKKALAQSDRNDDRDNEISSVNATNCSNKEYRISADNRSKNISSVKASLQDNVNDGRGYASPSMMKRNSLISQTTKNNFSKDISHIKKTLLKSDRNDDRDNEISSVDATSCSNKEDQISTDHRSKNISSVNGASLQDDMHDGSRYGSSSVGKRNSLISQTSKNNRSKNVSHTKKALAESDRNDDRDNEISSVNATNCSNKEYRISTDNRSKNVSSAHKASLQSDENDDGGYESSSLRKTNFLISQTSRTSRPKNILPGNTASFLHDVDDDLRDKSPSKSYCSSKEIHLPQSCSKNILPVKKSLAQNYVNDDRDDQSSDARRSHRSSKKYRISINNWLENISTVNEALVQDDLNDDRAVEPLNVSKPNCLNKENRLSTTNGPTTVSHVNKALLQNDVNDDRDDESSDARRSHRSSRKYRISRNNQLENISTVNGALDQDDLNDDRDVEPLNVSKSNGLNKENRLSTTNGHTTVSRVNKALLQNDVNDDRDDESSDARRSHRSSRKYRISRNNQLENISTVNGALDQDDLNDDRDVEPLNVSKSNGLNKENRLSTTNGHTTVSHVNKALLQNDVNDDRDDESSDARRNRSSRKYRISRNSRLENISTVNEALVQNDLNDDRDVEPLNVSKSNGLNKENRLSTTNGPTTVSPINKALYQNDVNDYGDDEPLNGRKSSCSNKEYNMSTNHRSRNVSLQNNVNEVCYHEPLNVSKSIGSNKERQISTNNLSKNISSVNRSLFQGDVNSDRDEESPRDKRSNCSNKKVQISKKNRLKKISVSKALFQNDLTDDSDNEPLSANKSNCSNKEYQLFKNNRPTTISPIDKALFQTNVNDSDDDDKPLNTSKSNCSNIPSTNITSVNKNKTENNPNLKTCSNTDDNRELRVRLTNHKYEFRQSPVQEANSQLNIDLGCENPINLTTEKGTAEDREISNECDDHRVLKEHGVTRTPKRTKGPKSKRSKIGKNVTSTEATAESIGKNVTSTEAMPELLEVRRSARERKPRILTYSMCIEISEKKLGRLLGIRRGERLTKSVEINSFNQSRCPTPQGVQKIKKSIRRNTNISTISENSNGESSSSDYSAIPNIVPCHQENTADPQDNINVFNNCQSDQMSNFSHTEIEERLNSSSKIKLKVVKNDVTFTRRGDNLRYSDLLTDKNGSSMLYLEIPPGESKRPHKSWKYNLFYFVNEGRGKVKIDGTLSEFRKGGRFFVPKGVTYSILNQLKTKPMILACVRTPV